MTKKVTLAALIVFLTAIPHLKAQEVYGGTESWFLLLNSVQISEKWSVGNEFHVRRHDWLKQQKQVLERPFVDYHAHKNLILSAGYTFINNQPHGEYPASLAINEHNIWEQVQLLQSIGKVNIAHRFRLENRFIDNIESQNGEPVIQGRNFTNRFRYRLTARFPLVDFNDQQDLYMHIFDELWINMYDNLWVKDVNQNWLYAGVGYHFNTSGAIEFAYVHQVIPNPVADRINVSPTLQLTVVYNLDISK